MVNVKNQRCLCGKAVSPCFNFPEEKAICCKECKTEGMVNVKHQKCLCRKVASPSFNFPGKKAICCKECKHQSCLLFYILYNI